MVTRTITAIWRKGEKLHLSVSFSSLVDSNSDDGANLQLIKERVKSFTGFQLYSELDGYSDRKSLIRM